MTAAESLAQARAALTVIRPEPFNAEAPPEALAGAITPTDLHYVRSNFALPVHDGILTIGGVVRNTMTLTLDDLRGMPAVERAVTLECAGNRRLAQTPLPVGEPGANTPSRPPVDRRPAVPGPGASPAGGERRRCHLRGSRSRPLPPVRGHHLRPIAGPCARGRPGGRVLIAYEMNGARCSPTMARRSGSSRPLVRRRVGQMADADRRLPRAEPGESRPATTCTSGPINRTSRSP